MYVHIDRNDCFELCSVKYVLYNPDNQGLDNWGSTVVDI